MFKLPKCPHCGTIYRYKDVREALKKKDNTCYHCEKKFTAKVFPGIIAGAGLPIILAVLVNIFLMTRMKDNLELIPLFIVTVAFILLIILIIPFFTKFQKTDDEPNKNEKQK